MDITKPLEVKLTKEKEKELLKIKKNHQSNLIRDRALVILARNNGLTISNIAKALSRSEAFIKTSILLHKKGQLEELHLNSNNHKLTPKQKEEIIVMIQKEIPKDLKDFNFKDQFWTTNILKSIIKKRYQIEYRTEKSYYDLFKKAGFSFHQPKTKDFRQDPEKMKEFKGALKKTYKTTKIRFSW